MIKTTSLLSFFNSQGALYPGVCLAGKRSCSKTPLHRSHHRKSTGVDLNRLPNATLSLTKRHTPRYSATFKSP
jgi:hypothetical protein